MKLIIAGSRDLFPSTGELHDYNKAMRLTVEISEVVSGCAQGVDTCGEQWASTKGLPIKRFLADWKRHDLKF